MDNSRRTIAAIVCGSLGPAILFAALDFSAEFGTLYSAGTLFAVTWASCAVGASTLGLAWHVLALDRAWTKALQYVVAGAALGACIPGAFVVTALVYALFAPLERFSSMDATLALIVAGAILGGLTALIFWLIRRPDRDQSASASNDTSA
jgi:hypothetical protein